MNEKDFEYLNNIDTRPGPNAGRSIDPSKPGPDADLAQSDAEPVAWRYASPNPPELWAVTCLAEIAEQRRSWGWPVEPLYTAPPRPDASAGLAKEIDELQRENKVLRAITRGVQADASAGLIEAAELAIDFLSERKFGNPARSAEHNARVVLESALRACAADRSGK